MCLRNVMITTFFCIGLITGIFHVSAQLSDSGIFGVQNIGIPLIPGHSGSDYIFIGDYSDGQIRILAPGLYYCTDNMRTTSEDYAIRLENQSVTLDGSGHQVMGSGGFCDGVQILPESYQCIIRNFSLISDFYHGIYSEGEYAFIHNNTIRNASAHGIQSRGNYSQIHFNTVEDTGDVCIFSYGDNSSLYHNYVFRGRNGILNHGNHADISRNYAINNYRYGIAAGGVFVGPDPGDTGKGYYTIMKDNIALMNGYSGLISYMPHGVVYDNIAIQNSRAGIDTTVRSNNTTLSGNMVMNNTLGIRISDQARDLIVRQNRITAHTQADLFILQNNSCGYGAIFDNYFGSLVHLDGAGHIENFTWTNPNGPTPGKNIISGPFIAGNYWSNPDGNGWSDIQAPTVTGYSQVPYEVKSGQGVYDTAPLVRVLPRVENFYPYSGRAGDSIDYVVIGKNLKDGALVNLTRPGEVNLTSIASLSGGNLSGSLWIPPVTLPGPWNVSVNQGGLFSNDDIQFIILPPVPVITGLIPGGAVQNLYIEPFQVIITGTGFDTVSGTSNVTVDGFVVPYTIESATRINATFPEAVDNTLGNHPVIVTGMSGSSDPYTFIVSSDRFTIDASSDEIGWINPSGVFTVEPGTCISFEFMPTAGARIKNLTVNSVEQSIESPFVIPAVDRDYAVRLNNEPLPGVIIAAFYASSNDEYSITFKDASFGSPDALTWDFGDGTTSTGNEVKHTYIKDGVYRVTLWARTALSQSQVTGEVHIPLQVDHGSSLFFKS